MRKIVNGKVYDTDKSQLLYSDLWRRINYYMTAKRAFFRWYKSNDKIVVMTEDEMKEFLGEHDYEKYVEIFGEPDEA